MSVPVDHVLLQSIRPGGRSVLGRLGEGAPTLSGGVGGWEAVGRPGRRPLTIWRGAQDPLRLTIPFLFDGHASRESVEPDCRRLEILAGLSPGDPEPPRLEVRGPSIPHGFAEAPGTRWVIESIEWDVIRRRDGDRVRQAVSVVLLRYVEDDTLSRVKARRKAPRHRYAEARKGDTFEKIAIRELGNAPNKGYKRLGARLARLNGKRSPDVKLKEGRRVKLPSVETTREWVRDLR